MRQFQLGHAKVLAWASLALSLCLSTAHASFLSTRVYDSNPDGTLNETYLTTDTHPYELVTAPLSRSGSNYTVTSLAAYDALRGQAQSGGSLGLLYAAESRIGFTLGGLPAGTPIQAVAVMGYHFNLSVLSSGYTGADVTLRAPNTLGPVQFKREFYGNFDYTNAPPDQRPGEYAGTISQAFELPSGTPGLLSMLLTGTLSAGVSDASNTVAMQAILLPEGVTFQYDASIPAGANPLNFQTIPEPTTLTLFATLAAVTARRPNRHPR